MQTLRVRTLIVLDVIVLDDADDGYGDREASIYFWSPGVGC